nr:TolC family protein [Rhizobiaceae bacterium]
EIRLSWNILDFGLSYVRAKQVADEIQIARENRRRIVNRIIEDVRTAYWRAVSADSLISGLRSLEGRVRRAMANSKALETDGESSPLTALTYQRELVEIQDEIQKLESELSIAKTQLAALMNIEPGTPYRLAQPARSAKRLKLTLGARQMVEFAVEHRPELRDVAYRERINALEAEKALLELFPSASLFLGGNASSNAFLYNNAWLDYGAKASWNVMKLFRYPERKLEIEAQRQLFDQRALAVTMAIMTQVHVGRARYHFAAKRFATAQQHLAIQSGILKQIKAAAAVDQVSEQTVIREEMNTLVSRVKYDIAYADLQNAYANIYASMGVDAIEEDFSDSESVAALSEKLRRAWLERGDTSGVITRIRKKHAPVEAAPADKPVAAVDQANPSTIVALTAKETGLQVSSEASATEAVVPVAKRQSRVRVATARD